MIESEKEKAARLAEEAMQGAAEARLRRLLITDACNSRAPGEQPPLREVIARDAAVKCFDKSRLRSAMTLRDEAGAGRVESTTVLPVEAVHRGPGCGDPILSLPWDEVCRVFFHDLRRDGETPDH